MARSYRFRVAGFGFTRFVLNSCMIVSKPGLLETRVEHLENPEPEPGNPEPGNPEP
jgi:hypothetical protein